jgi:phosphocarrier protein HPr
VSDNGTGQDEFIASETEVMICNRLGMHARAATRFVTTASKFRCDVRVRKDDKEVNGKSIMGLMMLAASKGTRIEIRALGPDAPDAIEALRDLVNNRFREDD